MKKFLENKGFVLIVVGILLLCVVGVSFAYFSVSGTQNSANTITSGCFSVSIENEGSAITLTNATPKSDTDGLKGTPYTFTVKNTCDKAATYQLNLESLNQVTNTLSADYIRVGLSTTADGNITSTLSDNTSVTPTISGAYAAHRLYSGTMNGNTEKVFNLRLWIDYDATIAQAANKTYTSKINLTATSV